MDKIKYDGTETDRATKVTEQKALGKELFEVKKDAKGDELIFTSPQPPAIPERLSDIETRLTKLEKKL